MTLLFKEFVIHLISLCNNHIQYVKGHNRIIYKVHDNTQEINFSHEKDLTTLLKILDVKLYATTVCKQVCAKSQICI